MIAAKMRIALLALATACAAVLGLPPVAAAATASVERVESRVVRQAGSLAAPKVGDGWIGLPAGYPLGDVRHTTLAGTRDELGDCQFDTEISASARQPAVLARTRAVHVTRCLAVFELGVPPGSVVARYDAEQSAEPGPDEATATVDEEAPSSYDAQDEATPDIGVSGPPTTGAQADGAVASVAPPCEPGCRSSDWVAQHGYYRTWFEDPLNIDVNVVRQELYWLHYGPRGCVLSDSSELKTSVYEQTGWYLNRQNRRTGHTCSRAFTSGFAKFTNDKFCRVAATYLPIPVPDIAWFLISPTRVYYNRAIARGFNTGLITGNTRWSKKGGCSELLSFNHMARHYS